MISAFDYKRFENNLISVIKEAQIKLGFEDMAIGVNYTNKTLSHLLSCDEGEVYERLIGFTENEEEKFGKITINNKENGVRLDVPKKGANYVFNLLKEDEFLSVFINTVKKPTSTIDDIIKVFKSFSDKVHIEKTENGEFDYLIFFENGDIDDFWYCFHTDELSLEYHRFIKEDYLDFNF